MSTLDRKAKVMKSIAALEKYLPHFISMLCYCLAHNGAATLLTLTIDQTSVTSQMTVLVDVRIVLRREPVV